VGAVHVTNEKRTPLRALEPQSAVRPRSNRRVETASWRSIGQQSDRPSAMRKRNPHANPFFKPTRFEALNPSCRPRGRRRCGAPAPSPRLRLARLTIAAMPRAASGTLAGLMVADCAKRPARAAASSICCLRNWTSRATCSEGWRRLHHEVQAVGQRGKHFQARAARWPTRKAAPHNAQGNLKQESWTRTAGDGCREVARNMLFLFVCCIAAWPPRTRSSRSPASARQGQCITAPLCAACGPSWRAGGASATVSKG
jgi:hypothetical protein